MTTLTCLIIEAKLVTEASEERTAGAGPTVNPSQRVATSTTGSRTVVSVGGRTTVSVGDRSSSAGMKIKLCIQVCQIKLTQLVIKFLLITFYFVP